MRSRVSRRRHGERGETLVEFAFASVILLTMIFGAVVFGIAIWNFNLVSDLAQEGARWAAVRGAGSLTAATTTDVQNFVQSRALGLTVTVTTPAGAPNTINRGNPVVVTVSHTLNLGGGLLPLWTYPIQSTGRMIVTR